MSLCGRDTLNARKTLTVGSNSYDYFSLPAAEAAGLAGISRLPFSLKILLENLLRHEDGATVTVDDVKSVAKWLETKTSEHEIAYRPARVLMQDFTGVPAVVDLAAMRDAMVALGKDPQKINPLSPVDLVIDHSVMVDAFGSKDAMQKNMDLEFERNGERYAFLRWGQTAFDNFRVVPPGTGICHQVNVEYLAKTIWSSKDENGKTIAYPDTLVGTDSHTTMVNGLGVLGWGVGGIEAEAAMLGQPISMLIPEVVGFCLTGKLNEGTTATDLVLTVTEMLRKKGVVGKFVEFFGPGLDNLPLTDRATISNMAPEYGATCGIFPIDQETLDYLAFTGREPEQVELVKAYAQAQGFWRDSSSADAIYTDTLELDMATVEPSLAGPKRPQDRITLKQAAQAFKDSFPDADIQTRFPVSGQDHDLGNGDVMIAAITSCTNTSNPSVLVAAGLLAQKAVDKGLVSKPWVKTSLAPGSQVVTDYLESADLMKPLEALGFDLVGYGCTTCIGNSGPLADEYIDVIDQQDLTVSAVLSGNRNFEGRVSPNTKANYLASPPLVVAYAIAGNIGIDLLNEPLGQDSQGADVYLADIWPTPQEIQTVVSENLTPAMYRQRSADVFEGPQAWKDVKVTESMTYAWDEKSTYVKNPPYFEGLSQTPPGLADVIDARPLAILGDSVTTDHISPAGNIKANGPAGAYLDGNGVPISDFNSYGARRGNHEVMMRGTFANIRIKNEMVPGTEGGVTKWMPEGEEMPIYDAAMKYQAAGVPLVIVAGKEYGTGSSRDWAAKGTKLLGVKAVIVESFERIHRSNLVGMGIVPLQFKDGDSRQSLGLDGSETYTIIGLSDLKPRQDVDVTIIRANGDTQTITVMCRVDTLDEVSYMKHGGILSYVLRNLAAS